METIRRNIRKLRLDMPTKKIGEKYAMNSMFYFLLFYSFVKQTLFMCKSFFTFVYFIIIIIIYFILFFIIYLIFITMQPTAPECLGGGAVLVVVLLLGYLVEGADVGAVVGEVHKGLVADEAGQVTAVVPLTFWPRLKGQRPRRW